MSDVENRDAAPPESRGRAVDPIARRELRGDSAPPLLPKDATIDRVSNGIRVKITGRSIKTPDGAISGSVRYDVQFVAFCDLTSADKIAAAYRASINVDSIDEPGVENQVVERTYTEAKYASGYWFIVGVTADGRRSEPSYPRNITAGILDDRVPPFIRHLQISESGIGHDGVAFSELSGSFLAPNPLDGFTKFQPVIVDYPSRGQTMEWVMLEYGGIAGGVGTFKLALPPSRRKGVGTVTATGPVPGAATAIMTFGGGENCNVSVAAGDVVEILGIQATIQSVDSAGQITLTAPWTGETVAAFTEYFFIGKCRVYMRSLSAGNAFEEDLSLYPGDSYADLILDANLSFPVSPTVTLATAGNVVRIVVSGVVGTLLDKVLLYRAVGVSVVPNPNFPNGDSNYTLLKSWPANPLVVGDSFTYEDTKFSDYQKEHKQVFSYVAIVTNIGNDTSFPSTVQSIACGLDAPSDNGPQEVARELAENLLWNGGCYFNANTTVDVTSAVQDTEMGGAAPPAGFYRWDHEESGGSTPAGFQNTKEVILPFPGAGKFARLKQKVDAWDHATAGNRRIPKGKYLALQTKARTSGGQPNGTFRLDLWQWNGATYTQIKARRRLTDDSILFDLSGIVINGSDMTTDHQWYWGVFQPDWTITTLHILATLTHQDSTGVNINVTEVMLSIGDTPPTYTTKHVDSNITYNIPTGGMPTPPGRFPDGDADGRNFATIIP